jgi:hypothetical protein
MPEPDDIHDKDQRESSDWCGELESALGFGAGESEGDPACFDPAMDEDECATYGLSPDD